MRALLTIALISPMLALGASCLLDSFNRVEESTAPLDSGVDAPAPDAALDAGCAHAWTPGKPASSASGGGLDLVLALRWFSLDAMPDGGPVGLDLDRTCTCQGEESSCKLPDGVKPDAGCDLPEGRDNAAAGLFFILQAVLGQNISTFYTSLAENGGWSLLIRVSDYNGEPDDAQVQLAWYVSTGMPPMQPPAWDGGDRWTVSAASVLAGLDGGPDFDKPVFLDNGAYVANGVLVGTLPTADMLMSGGTSRMELRFTACNIMGRLEPPTAADHEGLWKLTGGLVTARIRMEDMFRGIGSYRDDEGKTFCLDNPLYNLGRSYMCAARDIVTSIQSTSRPCDALSMGLAFEALQAQVGEVAPGSDASPNCPPDADPSGDQCPLF